MKKFFTTFLLTATLLSLASCGNTIISEAFSHKYLNKKIDLNEERGNSIFRYNDLLGKRVAILAYVKEEKGIPGELFTKVKGKVYQNVLQTNLFASLLNDAEVNSRLNKQKLLKQETTIYLDSLANVAVSDKDISSKVGKYLNSDTFLVYQIDLWPCDNCITKDIMSIKLRLVETGTGAIIWTGIAEEREIVQENDLESSLFTLTDELVGLFYHRFKNRWHIKRFDSLKTATLF
jgi:hypothetical protein